METLNLGKTRIQYLDTGEGAPLVLAHCSSGSHREWSFLVRSLVDQHRILAPDLLGYGASEPWPEVGLGPSVWDDEVIEAVMDMAGAPVHLVGHSYGAAACLEVARRDAESGRGMVKSLFLVEPVSFHLLRRPDYQRQWTKIERLATQIVARSARGDFRGAANAYMGFWLGSLKWRLAPRAFRKEVLRTMPKVAAEFRALFQVDHGAERYAEIDFPITLVRGGRSPRPATAVVDILAQTLPHANVRALPSAGHMSPFTHKSEVAKLVESHLGLHRASSCVSETASNARTLLV
jgi:pimeloyl-ACP methyl ester carboxylesterase